MSRPIYVMTQKRPQEKYCYQSFVGEPLDVDLYNACKEHLKKFFSLKNLAFDSLTFDIHEFRRNCKETPYAASYTYPAMNSAINRYGLFSSKNQVVNDVSIRELYQLGKSLDNNEALWRFNQFLVQQLEKLASNNLNQAAHYSRGG